MPLVKRNFALCHISAHGYSSKPIAHNHHYPLNSPCFRSAIFSAGLQMLKATFAEPGNMLEWLPVGDVAETIGSSKSPVAERQESMYSSIILLLESCSIQPSHHLFLCHGCEVVNI